ncbi:FAD-dependent oxidoreductase [Actinocorallia longicatena]|uniref:L-2-hydroxyglutarate oxidase n=1 Tax=Actinocorallia longicatena TaxID=111803 RepID=A0ABP6Q5U1_9ACTN
MRIGVIGAGILGLAVARRLGELGHEVTVLEKEDRVAGHQTGHNSGVAHAGLYYAPGSLKAELCRRGIGLLKEFCQLRGIAYDECGKIVVARNQRELEPLLEIERRAALNGVPGLRRLDRRGLREIEPAADGLAALHSPTTAIVDFPGVARALAEEVRLTGGVVRLGHEVIGIKADTGHAVVTSKVRALPGLEAGLGDGHSGDSGMVASAEAFDRLVVCAGLHSDRVAMLAGDAPEPAILPFRGEYYRLRSPELVRGLIYPVPDPRYPFLGVHFTRRVDGSVDIGPNAVLAGAREGYRRRDVSVRDLWDVLRWPGFPALALEHWRTGAKELYGSASKRAFVREARSFVPGLRAADVVAAPSGVRAQAVDADGSLVDDFRLGRIGAVLTVRNAPSPGATSSLAIAEHLVTLLLKE